LAIDFLKLTTGDVYHSNKFSSLIFLLISMIFIYYIFLDKIFILVNKLSNLSVSLFLIIVVILEKLSAIVLLFTNQIIALLFKVKSEKFISLSL
jgi:hypothetical protein